MQQINDIDTILNEFKSHCTDKMGAVFFSEEKDGFAILHLKEDNDDNLHAILEAIAGEYAVNDVEIEKAETFDFGYSMELQVKLLNDIDDWSNETIYLKLATIY